MRPRIYCVSIILLILFCVDGAVELEISDRLDRNAPSSSYVLIIDGNRHVLSTAGGGGRQEFALSANEEFAIYTEYYDSNSDGEITFDDSTRLVVCQISEGAYREVLKKEGVTQFALNPVRPMVTICTAVNDRFGMEMLDLVARQSQVALANKDWIAHPTISDDGTKLAFYMSSREDRIFNQVILLNQGADNFQTISRNVGNGWALRWHQNQLIYRYQISSGSDPRTAQHIWVAYDCTRQMYQVIDVESEIIDAATAE